MHTPLLASSTTQALTLQFGWSSRLVLMNVDGLSHEDSLLQPAPSGNCLNWVLGHMVASRHLLLPVLGDDSSLPAEQMEMYGRHSSPIAGANGAVPFESLVEEFARLNDVLLRRLPSLEHADLDEAAPFSTAGRDNETLGSLVTGFAFHEAYHAGQVSPLRRLAGRHAAFQ